MSQYTKYKLYKLQQRVSGSSDPWVDVVPTTYSYNGNGTQTPVVVESASTDCGYTPPVEPMYKWVTISINQDYVCDECPMHRTLTTATTCVGVDKYELDEYQVSYDSGTTWTTTATSATTLIEADSEDCGYVPPIPSDVKLYCRLNNNLDPFIVYCDDTCGGEDPTHLVWTCAAGTTASTHMLTAQIGTCVSQIENEALYGCSSLKIVEIPSTVTSIGASAFTNCYSLISITIPSGVTVISDSMCYSCGLNHTPFTVNMPNSITDIGNKAFFGCQTLENIELSSNLVRIGEDAFRNCYSLKSINIPNSVRSIGQDAFGRCSSLSSVTIAEGVETIGSSAFWQCYSLSSVTVNATTPPTLGAGAFSDTPIASGNGYIYVPSGSVNTYKLTSGWASYASRIQAIPNS